MGSKITVSPDVIESFAFHASLISVAVFLGWILNKLLKAYLNFSVSWFVAAMIGGFIVQLVILIAPKVFRSDWFENAMVLLEPSAELPLPAFFS